MQSSSATCGIGCGASPPPIPCGGGSQVVEHDDALRVQYCAGGAGDGEPEREGVSGDVWEVAGDGVRLLI
jgi:hypothetical protein